MIDVVITHYERHLTGRLSPGGVARDLTDKGYVVRSVVILNSDTGLVATYYSDEVT